MTLREKIDFMKEDKTGLVFPFGKYKGIPPKEVSVKDPSYILWFINNIRLGEYSKKFRKKLFEVEEYCEEVVPLRKIYKTKTSEKISSGRNIIKEDIFPFGKYKGVNFREVLERDPEYLLWFYANAKENLKSNKLKESLLYYVFWN